MMADGGQLHRLIANSKAACVRPASRDAIKSILTVSLIIPYAEQSTFRNCHFADQFRIVSNLQNNIKT
jgi:hypothetical protein